MRTAADLYSYGESHCRSVGCIVDGCPPGLPLTAADIQPQMTRRRPGQSALTTPRDEKDQVQIQSGTENGITLGTPIAMIVLNENQRPKDYGNSTMDLYPRPSHADFTYLEKYGVKASSGGGRSSARETIGRRRSSTFKVPAPGLTLYIYKVAWQLELLRRNTSPEHTMYKRLPMSPPSVKSTSFLLLQSIPPHPPTRPSCLSFPRSLVNRSTLSSPCAVRTRTLQHAWPR